MIQLIRTTQEIQINVKSYDELVRKLEDWKKEKYNPIIKRSRVNALKDGVTIDNCPLYIKDGKSIFCLLFPNDHISVADDCRGICYTDLLPCRNYRYLSEERIFEYISESREQIEDRISVIEKKLKSNQTIR